MKSASIIIRDNKNRYSKNRALLEINNKPTIYYVAKRVSKAVEKVTVRPQNEVQAEKILSKVPYVDDLAYNPLNNNSPVSGMFSTLNNSPSGKNLLVSCNRVLINPKVIDYLFEKLNSYGSDAVIPRFGNGKLEYFLSTYDVEKAKEAAEKSLKNDEVQIKKLLEKLDVKYVPIEQLRKIDSDLHSFKKVNSKKNEIKEIKRKLTS